MMRFTRIFMAVAVALSVAMLPVAGSASFVLKSADISESSASAETAPGTDMSAMDDCCPDQEKPCAQRGDQCQSMASCPFLSVNVADVSVSSLKHPALSGNLLPTLVDQAAPLHDGSPPFRPPRV